VDSGLQNLDERRRLDSENEAFDCSIQRWFVSMPVEGNIAQWKHDEASEFGSHPLSDLKHRQLFIARTLIAIIQHDHEELPRSCT